MNSSDQVVERDYTTTQAMKSYVDASKLAGDAAIERNALKAELTTARATLASIRAIVADPAAALVADRVRAALEATS